MYVLQDDADVVIKWPVKFKVPASGGVLVEQGFTGHFRHLDDDAFRVLTEETHPVQPGASTAEVLRRNAAIFASLLVDWDDVTTADGVKVPIGDPEVAGDRVNLVRLVTGRHGRFVSTGLWEALTKLQLGMVEEDAKNA